MLARPAKYFRAVLKVRASRAQAAEEVIRRDETVVNRVAEEVPLALLLASHKYLTPT